MVIDAENLLNVVQVMSLCFTIFVDLPDRRSVQFSIMYILCMCMFALPMLVTLQ